jgi:hypothetical protein
MLMQKRPSILNRLGWRNIQYVMGSEFISDICLLVGIEQILHSYQHQMQIVDGGTLNHPIDSAGHEFFTHIPRF